VRPARSSKAVPLAALLLVALAAPARAANIEGRVIHPTRPDAAAGTEVVLLGVDRNGESIERKTRTDSTGQFRLTGLPTPAAYLVEAMYERIGFPGGSVVLQEGDADATRTLTFHIYDPSADASRLVLRRVRYVLEREAGVYRVRQGLTVYNADLNVVVRDDSEPPVLRVGLPVGHAGLETARATLPAGVRVRGDTLELHGPVSPGERQLQFSYDLAGPGADLVTAIGVPDPVETLEVYVRDFGIVVDAGPLHPARPVRDADTIYQRYAGFDLDAKTRIPFRVRALPPRSPAPSWVTAFLSALVAAGSLFFVGQPVSAAAAAGSLPASETESERAKQALIAALRDLEHDFETGKLSSEDRDRLRRDLRRDALLAMTRQQAAASPTTPTDALQPCRCGRVPQAGDLFCAACGSPL
jgi:hypothetical protein